MKLAIISNVNLDMLIQQTAKKHDVFKTDGYGQWFKFALSSDDELMKFAPECVFILLDGYTIIDNLNDDASISSELATYTVFIRQLSQRYPTAMIAVSSIHVLDRGISMGDFDQRYDRLENKWDEHCAHLMTEIKTIHKFQLRELIFNHGIQATYDSKMWYMGSIPYSIGFIKELSYAIDSFAEKLLVKRKKVLVVDLDNTIWGGVVGEDGALGITIGNSLKGSIYRDTQRILKQMKENGVLLAISSKNNYEDVKEAFEKNTHMVLHEDDFSAIRIGWEPKVQSIKSIADELNLGLDSFVFLDDNNVERETVKQEIPEISIVDFPRDVSKLPKVLQSAYDDFFWVWRVTEEDKSRTLQYHQEATRRNEQQQVESGSISIDEYLKSLNIKILIDTVSDNNIERVVQLLNKTNQFNTNTVRMNINEMQEFINVDSNSVFVATVHDKYGDSGLIAVIMISRDKSAHTASVVNFLMSCRVMGRQIEHAVVRAIEEKLKDEGYTEVHASYISTAKNSPVKDIWSKLGYSIENTDDSGNTSYRKDITKPQVPTILSAEWVRNED